MDINHHKMILKNLLIDVEDKEGYLTNKFYNLYENSSFKFNSGIFANFIFKIINLRKNKMNILLGNLRATTRKEKFILKSI